MTPLAVSLNPVEIHHLRNLLEAEGIRCWIRNELLSRLAGEIPFTEVAIELHVVDEADRWRAEKLVEAWRSAPPPAGETWRCPTCGETIEGQFTACWRCGLNRV